MTRPRVNWETWAPVIVTGLIAAGGGAASIGAYAIHNEHRLTVIETRLDEIKSRMFPTSQTSPARRHTQPIEVMP